MLRSERPRPRLVANLLRLRRQRPRLQANVPLERLVSCDVDGAAQIAPPIPRDIVARLVGLSMQRWVVPGGPKLMYSQCGRVGGPSSTLAVVVKPPEPLSW